PDLLDVAVTGGYRIGCGAPATGGGMDRAVGTAIHSTDPPWSGGSSRRNIAGAATRGRRRQRRCVGCIVASGSMISGTKWLAAGLVLVAIPRSMSAQNRWARQVHDQL